MEEDAGVPRGFLAAWWQEGCAVSAPPMGQIGAGQGVQLLCRETALPNLLARRLRSRINPKTGKCGDQRIRTIEELPPLIWVGGTACARPDRGRAHCPGWPGAPYVMLHGTGPDLAVGPGYRDASAEARPRVIRGETALDSG